MIFVYGICISLAVVIALLFYIVKGTPFIQTYLDALGTLGVALMIGGALILAASAQWGGWSSRVWRLRRYTIHRRSRKMEKWPCFKGGSGILRICLRTPSRIYRVRFRTWAMNVSVVIFKGVK